MRSHNREPIPHTCPDIDSLISQLENLRRCNDELRQWGISEAKNVDELESRLEESQEENNTLNEENDLLEKKVNDLEIKLQSIKQTVGV